jgi:hypothetical protein
MTERTASNRDRGDRRKRKADNAGKGQKIGARSSALIRRMSPNMWRVLGVVALAGLAGLTALIALSTEPTKYERESSFAIRPSDTVPPDAVQDVVATLSQSDSAVTESIVDMIGSARLRGAAAGAAGLSPDSVAVSGAEYSWLASRRPGSTIVDLRITGPNAAKVDAMQAAAARGAATLVQANYSVYGLVPLSAPTSADRVGTKTTQTVFLAVLLGALLGIGLVFAERKLRSSPAARTLDRGSDGRPPAAGDLTGETDRLESTLRQSLGGGASVRRVGPGRIEVAPPEDAPDRETARRKR